MMSSRLLVAVSILLPCMGGCAVSAGDEPEEVSTATEEMNGHNALSNVALGTNALTANRRALAFLRAHSLADAANGGAIFADYPDMRLQLHDARAKATMRYLASCALPAGSGVTYADPFTGALTTFQGEHGLCPAWAQGAPSQVCLERVSGCMLARVNAVGARVPISMRGPADVLSLNGVIGPETQYKDASAVASVIACVTRSYGLGRSCGFVPVAVGVCTPGNAITVGAGASAAGCASPLGTSNGDTMLRICSGIYGCDPSTPASAASYAGVIGGNDDRCGLKPAATFTCPANGFYSVMAATYDSGAWQGYVTEGFSVQASAGTLGANEQDVFRYLEGAFYGDIFDAENLATGVDFHVTSTGAVAGDYNLVVPTIFRRAHACYGPRWTEGAATITSRMCAAPGANCLMQITGACRESGYAPASEPRNRCLLVNHTGTGDYGDCLDRDGVNVWTSPITTYLNDPCDAVMAPGGAPPVQCMQWVPGAGP